mmetsp:Transcript_28707/g.101696  ORF Transcript_28707/g.101696 Transcript_28707/m.101696 type:complete len:364 (-) Transcript_28707:119-1210(-)
MRGGPRGGEELFAHLRERALPPTHGDGERPRVQVVLEHDTWFLGRPRASLARWRSRFFARRRTALRRHADEVEQVVKVVFRAAVRVRRKGARRALVVVLDDRPHHVSQGQSVLLCHPSRPALERRRVDGNVPVVAQEMAQHDERRRRDERRSDRGAVCDRTVEHQLARRRHVRLLDGLARKQRDAVDAVEDGRDGGPCLLVDAGDDRRIDEALRLAHQQMDFCPQHPAHHPQLGGSGDVDKPAPRRVDAEGCIPLGKCPHRVCGDSRKGAASPLLKLCDEDAVHARDVVRGACREDNNRVQDARDGVPRALAQKDDLTAASTFRRVIGRRHAPRVPLFADNRAPLHQNKITTVASRAIGMTLG